MSFDTFFEVWPNCLLAFPTVLAIDARSTSDRLGLEIERGSGTPRTFLCRARFLSTSAPAIPAAAVPTAAAGPLALMAAFLRVSTTAFPLSLTPLRLDPPPLRGLDLLWVWERRFAPPPLEREEPLRESAALLRERAALLRRCFEAVDFERVEPLDDAAPPERERPLALGFARDPFDEALLFDEPLLFDELLLLCALREAVFVLAIPQSLFDRKSLT